MKAFHNTDLTFSKTFQGLSRPWETDPCDLKSEKILFMSIIQNIKNNLYVESLSSLKKYFLRQMEISVSTRTNTSHTILFYFFSALLNWKHRNYNMFYDILKTSLVKLNQGSTRGKNCCTTKEELSLYFNEDLFKLMIKIIPNISIVQTNQSFENFIEYRNIEYMITTSRHSLSMFLLMIMGAFSYSIFESSHSSSPSLSHSIEIQKLNKEFILISLDNQFNLYSCSYENKDTCAVCSLSCVEKISHYIHCRKCNNLKWDLNKHYSVSNDSFSSTFQNYISSVGFLEEPLQSKNKNKNKNCSSTRSKSINLSVPYEKKNSPKGNPKRNLNKSLFPIRKYNKLILTRKKSLVINNSSCSCSTVESQTEKTIQHEIEYLENLIINYKKSIEFVKGLMSCK